MSCVIVASKVRPEAEMLAFPRWTFNSFRVELIGKCFVSDMYYERFQVWECPTSGF